MPNSIGSTGLIVATQAELVTQYTDAFQAIYGTDINLGPETPDGQLMMIFIQSVLDLEDLLVQIYNAFDPDNAIGNVLDQRVAINGIQRQAGTFTITNITLVISQSVNLYGLDQDIQPVYTVADNAGNEWQLQTTALGAGPGSSVYVFQAAAPGALATIPNTITVPVTVVLGVTSINNPTVYTTLGINEETDAQLKVRREQSVALPSIGFYDGMLAALLNINGVTFATIVENDTGATVNGVPGHSIWVIVAGSGSPADIGSAIYIHRSAGCGLYNSMDSGAEVYDVVQADGSIFPVYWDSVVAEQLFIRFTATSLNGVNAPNIAAIQGSLPSIYTPGVGSSVNINQLSTFVQDIDPNTLVTVSGFSTTASGSFISVLTTASPNYQFQLAGSNIIILPMILTPVTSTVPHGSSETFLGLGGYGLYTYSIGVNNSGGSIGSLTGLYVAGTTSSVTDTIVVTDSQGYLGSASVIVT